MSFPDNPSIVNNNVGSVNSISGKVEYGYYGYNIHKGPAIFFVIAFALCAIIHLVQTVRSRRWYLTYTITLGCALEALGWGFRLWSAESAEWDPTSGGFWNSSQTAFLGQISVLIFSPAFIIASAYVTLGVIVSRIGHGYTFLHPATYTAIFVTGDLVSLIVQAIGGGMASSADTLEGADQGAQVMVGGVCFQMAVMAAYTFLLATFTINYLRHRTVRQLAPFAFIVRPIQRRRAAKRAQAGLSEKPQVLAAPSVSAQEDKNIKLQLLGLGLCTLFIFIRSIYRTIELLNGWNGPIIENQTLFDVLDGVMILASVISINVFHPMFLLRHRNGSPDLEQKDLTALPTPEDERRSSY